MMSKLVFFLLTIVLVAVVLLRNEAKHIDRANEEYYRMFDSFREGYEAGRNDGIEKNSYDPDRAYTKGSYDGRSYSVLIPKYAAAYASGYGCGYNDSEHDSYDNEDECYKWNDGINYDMERILYIFK